MDPRALWNEVTRQLSALAGDAAQQLAQQLPEMVPEPSVAGTVLDQRLLSVVDRLPPGNSLVELVREILGDLDAASPVRLHGWQRAPGAPLGVALAVRHATGIAVLAVTPGGPVFDVVVTPGADVPVQRSAGPWTAATRVAAPTGWDAAVGPGLPAPAPAGTATVTLTRSGHLQAGLGTGPGLSVEGLEIRISATPTTPAAVEFELRDVRAAVLPEVLARLLGTSSSTAMASRGPGPVTLTARANRTAGLHFPTTGSPRVDLPLRIDVPGVRTRGAELELRTDGGRLRLGLLLSVAAELPALPLKVSIDRAGVDLPVALSPATRLGLEPDPEDVFPEGIGTDLTLPPVSGGGVVRRTADDGYAGLISVDLGFLRLQATALFRPPMNGAPTSFLVLLAAHFPPPGIQLGLGFAIDAVGGLVGINRRVEVEALRRLVSDGNADRVLFPDDAGSRAGQIVESLSQAYPVAPGRFLIGPMLRLTWGNRLVSLSCGLVLEAPAPVRAVLLGRLLVSVPDPVVPLIRLQASVFGRIEPDVPLVELLVSLEGSWIVGLAVRGEIYLLVRGGQDPLFILSAGGFHPRYTRPPGVPALRRLSLDLAPGGGFGIRMEAYFAVTSNTVQFGGQVHLQAMIAGCGVEGWLGLDALFIFDPVFAFSVRVRAGVAVRAFGRRLASVGLDFTLEGPAPWHAFGTGSISVLFWDVELDFDVHWGAPPARGALPGRDPADPLREAIAKPAAWTAERPAGERTGLTFTAAATKEIAGGTLVHPDSSLRVTQAVLPLGVPIGRFERRPIPEQTWTVASLTAGTPLEPRGLPSLPDRFVPGEFFDLTEEQQLSSPAFVTHAAGLRMTTDDVHLGPGHRVADRYETGYEPPPPDEGPREFVLWPGLFRLESVVGVGAAERLDRWRTPEVAVRVRKPPLAVATVTDLRPLRTDVDLVSATTDAWRAVQDEVGGEAGEVRLVERWELPT